MSKKSKQVSSIYSSSICALYFLPVAEVELQGQSETFTLDCGVICHAYKNGLFIFECEEWDLGSSVTIPEYKSIGREPVPLERKKADELAEKRIYNRVSLMNAFLVCTYSSISSVQRTAMGLSHEVTPTDYISLQSVNSIRLIEKLYPDILPLHTYIFTQEYNSSLRTSRFVIKRDTVVHAVKLLDSILSYKTYELLPLVTLLHKAGIQYYRHDFSSSVIFSWSVCEKLLMSIWSRHLSSLRDGENEDQRVRMNRDRWKKLLGRDYTASIVTEFIELLDLIPIGLYEQLNAVRKCRNNWLHELGEVTAKDASIAVNTSRELLHHETGISIRIPITKVRGY